ncbi:Transposase [Salibacterium halotolerans]|uniref:Transposase n=2 Tax=Salibacterium halotolerans TaxID=1884432 RepID=A0A1I5SCG6_9BACI|nr:Transposase [Salibacterium halotolerans]
MYFHSINDLLDLPELRITSVQKEMDTIEFGVEPCTSLQSCPTCRSKERVIRRGVAYRRKVRDLAAFGSKVFLHLPAIRLYCHSCKVSFVWDYEDVEPKKQVTKRFEKQASSYVVGATVKHAAALLQMPVTSLTRWFYRWMNTESQRIQKECREEAAARPTLVLGLDDFAIRKGHTYNTGLHDLRGETFLDVIPGRTKEELHDYIEKNPEWRTLQPTAVVLDLARSYHRFVKEIYPSAIRIADRYHVNRYVTEALQHIRKTEQKKLTPHAGRHLKRNHHLIGKRQDRLTEREQQELSVLLSYSPLLQQAHAWKESFMDWYDKSSSYNLAKKGFQRWLQDGASIDHPAVKSCLKTMQTWQEEICNYHKLRYTNAAVEGKNNKIKALQRRHYFTRNPEGYKQRILLECNEEKVQY